MMQNNHSSVRGEEALTPSDFKFYYKPTPSRERGRAGELPQRVKTLLGKPDKVGLSPRAHVKVEKDDHLHKIVRHTCTNNDDFFFSSSIFSGPTKWMAQ